GRRHDGIAAVAIHLHAAWPGRADDARRRRQRGARHRAGIGGDRAGGRRALFAGRFDALVGGAVPLDRAVRRLYRRRRAVLACFAWQLAGWSAGTGEIWLALVFLGHPVALADAFAIEAVIQALSSSAFVVPAALGVQEGGFLVVGGLVGLTPELALALALVRRARDVIIFVPALLLWQIGAGRRALSSA